MQALDEWHGKVEQIACTPTGMRCEQDVMTPASDALSLCDPHRQLVCGAWSKVGDGELGFPGDFVLISNILCLPPVANAILPVKADSTSKWARRQCHEHSLPYERDTSTSLFLHDDPAHIFSSPDTIIHSEVNFIE